LRQGVFSVVKDRNVNADYAGNREQFLVVRAQDSLISRADSVNFVAPSSGCIKHEGAERAKKKSTRSRDERVLRSFS